MLEIVSNYYLDLFLLMGFLVWKDMSFFGMEENSFLKKWLAIFCCQVIK